MVSVASSYSPKALLQRILRRAIQDTVGHSLRETQVRLHQIEMRLNDLITLRGEQMFERPKVRIETDHRVAIFSDDHRFPKGTAANDTRYPRFCIRSEQILGPRLRFLDIGCSGGGLVFDFLQRGHFAIGLEGSDYSKLNQRAHWPIIPNHLFTCDATKTFKVVSEAGGQIETFDLITAWEVLEHIKEQDLAGFFANVRTHLRPGGLFVASVATFEDRDPETGATWHQTVKPRPWWEDTVRAFGLMPIDSKFTVADFPRGSGNPTAIDWDAAREPHLGFHLVAQMA
jgi:2-polyprenyl-3-methyl-5-hydroxy-6-metoxy-1,4-benzoquinol methylase